MGNDYGFGLDNILLVMPASNQNFWLQKILHWHMGCRRVFQDIRFHVTGDVRRSMGISIDKLYDQTLEQAGYAGSSFAAGARDVLIGHVEKLVREHGLGETFDLAKSVAAEKYDCDFDAVASDTSTPVHRCMRESGAAAMSAIVSGAANSLEYLELVRTGKISGKDAAMKIIGETVASAADSALKAAGDTGRQIIIERYGTEENAIKALAEQGFQALLEKLPVGQGGKQIISDVMQLMDLSAGKLNLDPILQNGPNLIIQSFPAVQSLANVAGSGALDLVKAQFPNLARNLPKHPAVIAAAIVAVVGGAIAIKNGIERPYQDLLRNTNTLRESVAELDRVSRSFAKGQRLFGKYLEAESEMENGFQNQMTAVDKAGANALDAILKI